MSSDQPRPEKVDPLTAPIWPISNSESSLDPHFEQIRDDRSIHHRTIPAPPDVDQILSGEYTGWVPIIRAGETLAQAQQRADEKQNTSSQMSVETADGPRTSSEILGSIGPAQQPTAVTPPSSRVDYFVPDPDLVDSPADALELARQRIAQMREALQKSLSNVSKSFEHPIFKPESQPVSNPPVSHTRVAPPVQEPQPAVMHEPVIEEPVTHYRVQEQTVETELRATPQFSVDTAPVQDHSLELVIMRDEIKDLRTRLDASQKLIEDLMHRITNLAEMALRGRQN